MTAIEGEIKEQALHLLRYRGILRESGSSSRLVGLDREAAHHVVRLLADAGLLRDVPEDIVTPITVEQAEVRYRRGIEGGDFQVIIATAGTAMLRWLTADRVFEVYDHKGKYHGSADIEAAVSSYNQLITGQNSR